VTSTVHVKSRYYCSWMIFTWLHEKLLLLLVYELVMRVTTPNKDRSKVSIKWLVTCIHIPKIAGSNLAWCHVDIQIYVVHLRYSNLLHSIPAWTTTAFFFKFITYIYFSIRSHKIVAVEQNPLRKWKCKQKFYHVLSRVINKFRACIYIRMPGLLSCTATPRCARCNKYIIWEYHVVSGIPNKMNR
jgi:hypothetical protein